mmetsp:Transcript_101546/g.219241  ORF Transcript_101546/g.219241 Transcript_101546/m.219241 type:complete len:591 (-) Transcript_101546:134-1906(-)
MAFRWRNGFIEETPENDGNDGAASPRSVRSEPASIHSEHYESSFQGEISYVDNLNGSIDNFRSKISSGQGGSESGIITDFMIKRGTSRGSMSDHDTQEMKDELKDAVAGRLVTGTGATDSSTKNLRTEAVRQEVHRNLSKAKTQKTKHLTNALAAIEEISVQVSAVLQCSGTSYAEDVQDTIGALRTKMRQHDETSADAAMESLDVIPEMIMQSFEASAQVAKKTLQDRVDTVLRGIAEMELEDEEVVAQMRTIPVEVEDITKKAVEDAVSASQLQASLQVNFAMMNLPEWQPSLSDAKNRINRSVPGMGTQTVQVAMAQAVETMEMAVDAVRQHEERSSSRATNEVVADTLLRAKATSGTGTTLGPRVVDRRQEKPGLNPEGINPGSVGHPELCTRPCLYFAGGGCANGITCEFCHLPHSKRPAHLDKRNRGLLKEMPQAECVALVLPILQAKVDEMNLGSDMMSLVNNIGDFTEAGSSHAARKGQTKEKLGLLTALKAMSLRSLLMMLNRSSVLAPTHPQNLAIDAVWQHLRLRSHLLTVGDNLSSQAPCPDIPGLTPTPVPVTDNLPGRFMQGQARIPEPKFLGSRS